MVCLFVCPFYKPAFFLPKVVTNKAGTSSPSQRWESSQPSRGFGPAWAQGICFPVLPVFAWAARLPPPTGINNNSLLHSRFNKAFWLVGVSSPTTTPIQPATTKPLLSFWLHTLYIEQPVWLGVFIKIKHSHCPPAIPGQCLVVLPPVFHHLKFLSWLCMSLHGCRPPVNWGFACCSAHQLIHCYTIITTQ